MIQEDLEALPDIGPEVASSVIEFFSEQREMIEDILSEVEIQAHIQLSQFPLEKGGEIQV